MQPRTPTSPRSRSIRVLAPTSLTALLTATALATGGLAAPAASAASTASSVSLFPSDTLTVADAHQRTGLRVDLPAAGCTTITVCGLLSRINELDGFDLDPRLALHFDGPVAVDDVIASTAVTKTDGATTTGIDRVVYDAATHTVYAHPQDQLQTGQTYRLTVSSRRGLPRAETTFTTLSARDGLYDLRDQLDGGRAFAEAGIAQDQRGLSIDAIVPAAGTTFGYVQDRGTTGGLVPTPAVSLVTGSVVFGSYLAPSWLRPDRTIEQVPTRAGGPAPLDAQRLPFVLVVPPGAAPAGGWPTAIFGHGFTRSDGDVLLAAATNSAHGVATIGTDVVGHGYGPRSTWTVTRAGGTTVLPAYARGVDLDGNGTIDSTEGSSTLPTGAAAAVGSRDGLRQTTADIMTLVRALGHGLDLDAAPGSELRPSEVTYFGQSFGGIYGTMLAGTDPKVARSVLNVAGGPISEIVRLSPAFRPLETQALQLAGLLNSTSAAKGYFEESLPLRGQPPVLDPAPGALAIQNYLAETTWLNRPGSPETFSPRIEADKALFQVAFGDQTVPNPTAYTLLQAGGLFFRTALYRNDRTSTADQNPHGFLINPAVFPTASAQGQAQVLAFLTTGATIDPDGDGNIWQVPLRQPELLLPLNFTSPAFPNG